ncbi:endoglucanase [Cellvibrio sp. KY-GH-1]|uniref:cellulase family glycosylhydrolase n=1 Tax=Cellvibrio sp. KY-GH-1 TaxID=2303332 RepID=UPI001245D10A|nr:cellulase family glycosylhydrolase [Cellvibrio sp. KY-GH-1]QEY15627.1 endoglucanase [Cellvibrio sp. KY-GH-1]
MKNLQLNFLSLRFLSFNCSQLKSPRFKKWSAALALGASLFAAQTSLAQTATCKYVVTNNWGSGATANVEITNKGTSAINGWSVNWVYVNNRLSGSWNATITGSNPYNAANLSWNGNIQPGQTVAFGVQVNANNGAIETPAVTGAVCGGAVSSVSTSKSSSSTLVSSSVRSSSSSIRSSSSSSRSSVSSTRSSSSMVVSSSLRSSSSSVRSSSSIAGSSSSAGVLTSVQLTKLMGIGWNIGNSLDAIGGETAWGNPVITQQLINSVKAAGFKTIRLPVAWSKFSDESNFVIQTAWMDRVEQVVKYALNADMYVVMNIHWDNGWMQPTYAQQNYVNNRLKIMWTQIANRFKNYDNRLLFAGTNEVMVDGDYGTPTAEYYTVQNSFNQTFVTAVRATGGGNANRFLVVQGFNTNIDHTVNFAKIPTDTTTNRLLMEVHYYDPYNFTLNTNSNITQWGKNATNTSAVETWANESWVDSQFQKMKINFVDKGVGVILGEYGVVSRTNIGDHEGYRVYWNEYITRAAYTRGLAPIYWDNGVGANGGMALFDRASGTQLYPNLIQAIVKGDD